MKSSILNELDARGLIFQTTHDELDDALAEGPVTLYCGADPTADSLHVGSLLPIVCLAHFRRHGHHTMALVGGATGLIGDPSGKSEERNLLDDETIATNVAGIGSQIRTILDRALTMHGDDVSVDGADVPIVNNADWIRNGLVLAAGGLGSLYFGLRSIGRS